MTTSAIAAPTVQVARPEFIRLPRAGTVCPWTGLGRTYLFMLCKEGKVRSVSLRKEGAPRGVRLIHLTSVLEYIEKAANQGVA